jgi:glycosyltransferase involved in cell wall biosynthesis
LLPTLEIGGKERTVVDLCGAAPDPGIDPLIITYDPAPSQAQTLDPPCRHIALDRRRSDFKKSFRAVLHAGEVDVLHAHGHVSAVYAADAGLATIVTIHSALGSGWRWLPSILPALRRADFVTAVSEDLARATRRLTLRPVAMIATGLDVDRFAPPGGLAPGAGGPFTFGIAARLHRVKRHTDLFAAFRLLEESGHLVRLRVAGVGPLAAKLKAEAAAMPNIEMLGAVRDMPAFYRSIDAFILCSDHEGTPLALLEAMASGLPCIATRVGGMASIIAGGDCGVVGVRTRDPRALATAMARLASDEGLCRAAGLKCLAAVAPYHLSAKAEAYAQLYRRAASRATVRAGWEDC